MACGFTFRSAPVGATSAIRPLQSASALLRLRAGIEGLLRRAVAGRVVRAAAGGQREGGGENREGEREAFHGARGCAGRQTAFNPRLATTGCVLPRRPGNTESGTVHQLHCRHASE